MGLGLGVFGTKGLGTGLDKKGDINFIPPAASQALSQAWDLYYNQVWKLFSVRELVCSGSVFIRLSRSSISEERSVQPGEGRGGLTRHHQ